MQTVVNLRTEYLVVVNVTISGAQRWDTSRRFLLDPRYIPDTSQIHPWIDLASSLTSARSAAYGTWRSLT
jgi:hypothetical protein